MSKNELVLYENKSVDLEDCSDEEIDRLLSEIIDPTLVGRVGDKGEEKILDIYMSNIKNSAGLPRYEEVWDDVYGYNMEILYHVATIEFNRDYNYVEMNHDEADEIIDDIVRGYEELYTYGIYPGLDIIVANVLDKHRLSYRIGGNDSLYDEIEADIILNTMAIKNKYGGDIILNDCQNILMPDMLIFGFETNNDNISYFLGKDSECNYGGYYLGSGGNE